MKTHTIKTYNPDMEKAYLSNGLIGLRIGAIPLGVGKALVNGYWGTMEPRETECYEPAPYPMGLGICINNRWFSSPDIPGVEFISQEYDFSCGELRTHLRLHTDGVIADVELVIFCSRSWPTAICMETKMRVDSTCKLSIQNFIETIGLPGQVRFHGSPRVDCCDFVLNHESRGGLSTLGVAQFSQHIGGEPITIHKNDWGYNQPMPAKEFEFNAESGKEYITHTIATMVPSVLHSEPHWQAGRMLNLALWRGFEKLRQQNQEAWQELWHGQVKIHGADTAIQDIADASFFYVHSSIHPSTPCSVAPFVLSGTPLYNGMVFWDCESYCYPVALFTQPGAADAILNYRHQHLNSALQNARLQGTEGILFPWESGFSGDEMNKPWGIPTGKQTQNLLIAFAFLQHVYCRNDQDFNQNQAWPVLKGVVRWLCSRVTKTQSGYELQNLTGIGEDVGNLNNPSVVMMASHLVINGTIEVAKKLGKSIPMLWTQVADNLIIPFTDDGNRIRRSSDYDDIGRDSVDPLYAFFPLSYRHPDVRIEQNTLRHFLENAPAILARGGPMHNSYIGVWGARIGDRKLATLSLDTTIRRYVIDPYSMFGEHATNVALPYHKKSNPPLFQTTPAGFLNACMFGLTGLQLDSGDPGNWGKFPIILPESWKSIEIERITIHGRHAHLSAKDGAPKAEITWYD